MLVALSYAKTTFKHVDLGSREMTTSDSLKLSQAGHRGQGTTRKKNASKGMFDMEWTKANASLQENIL